MTVPSTIDAAGWLSKYLEGDDGDTDLARAMLQAFAETLMSAEASAACGAAYNERSEERTNSRNGYRRRPWDTRAGSIDLAVPKLREGSYFPDWLLAPRRRAEQALVAVIGQAYVEGVSTRRVDDLVKAMGIDGISRSEVSRMAAELDAKVAAFRDRPLDCGPYRYMWVDALTQKVREAGRVVNVSAVVATAVNHQGQARDRRLRHRDRRGHGQLDGVPAEPGGPGPGRRRTGHLRRPWWDQSGHRHGPVRRHLAAL